MIDTIDSQDSEFNRQRLLETMLGDKRNYKNFVRGANGHSAPQRVLGATLEGLAARQTHRRALARATAKPIWNPAA